MEQTKIDRRNPAARRDDPPKRGDTVKGSRLRTVEAEDHRTPSGTRKLPW